MDEYRLKALKHRSQEIKELFQGIGCFREKNTDKKIEVKLEMETDAKPVAQ